MAILTEKQSDRFSRASLEFKEALEEVESCKDRFEYCQTSLDASIQNLNRAEKKLLTAHSKMKTILDEVEGKVSDTQETARRIKLPLTTVDQKDNISSTTSKE